MTQKVTDMVINVDLRCPYCYKKIKKILCKYPQIRDQLYDEKGNTVTVTVVCCSPEKIRDKLCSRGCKVIKSIHIKEPEKNEHDRPKVRGRPNVVVAEKPKADGGNPKYKPNVVPPKAKGPEPVKGIPLVFPPMACYGPSYDRFGGGAPWYNGYGVPPPPQSTSDGYYGHGYGYPYGRVFDSYFSEENPSACSVM